MNGADLEMIEHFPFVLSPSKHSETFFSNLLDNERAGLKPAPYANEIYFVFFAFYAANLLT